MKNESVLADMHAKVNEMAAIINLDTFIEGEKNSLKQIRSYFRINKWAYRHYHSQEKFMHFRISQNGALSDKDVFHQPDSISQFIKKGDKVVGLVSVREPTSCTLQACILMHSSSVSTCCR